MVNTFAENKRSETFFNDFPFLAVTDLILYVKIINQCSNLLAYRIMPLGISKKHATFAVENIFLRFSRRDCIFILIHSSCQMNAVSYLQFLKLPPPPPILSEETPIYLSLFFFAFFLSSLSLSSSWMNSTISFTF